MAASRNDSWRWDELVLALNLYRRADKFSSRELDTECHALSEVLDRLGSQTGAAKTGTYRNRNGVRLKLMNFRRFDPKFQKLGLVGMRRGGKTEEAVWARYSGDTAALAVEADRIVAAIDLVQTFPPQSRSREDIYDAEEGGVQMRAHRQYERNRMLIARKKTAAAEGGQLICEACDFDFEARYGSIAAGFIEVHHTKPVHLMKRGERTRLSDLALLCSNCHRVAHRQCPPLGVAQIRALLASGV
jgi:5-methylcytosine-specific restriction enzyme A